MATTIEALDIRALTDDHIALANAFGNAIAAEARPEDPPTPLARDLVMMRTTPDYVRGTYLVALAGDGSWAGLAQVILLDTGDNLHACDFSLTVLDSHRRQGIGRALLERVVATAHADGRTLLITSTTDRVPAGDSFAARVGAQPALKGHTNRLVLADVDRAMVQRWIDDGPVRAPGYSVVGFDGVCPDDIVADVVDVLHVMNDQPRDDLAVEDRKMTVEQFRQGEKRTLAGGTEMWWLFARHDETGQLAGLSDVRWIPHVPETIFQGNTGVRPEHRGHALGKWLKAAMLTRIFAERPGTVDIRTGNADSNEAMLGINRELGFKPFIASTIWQLPIEKARAYLAG